MRIAIVGTGSIGRRHARNLLALGQRDLLLVSEHSRRESLAIEGVTLPAVPDYGAALAQCDVVVIANPSSLHGDYLRQALAHNKPVYLEKPVALTTAGGADLIADAARRKLTVAVGTQFRFNPRLLELQGLLQQGALGRILAVFASSGEHIADYHPDEDYRISYAARSELGGGVLLTQIHQIDYLNWLFGDAELVMASQISAPELAIDVESCVSYCLLARDRCAVAGHLNYLQRPKSTWLEVIGDQGRARWDYEANSLAFIPADGQSQTTRSDLDRNQMFMGCMQDFLVSVSSGQPPRAVLADGFRALATVEAIKRSCTSGQVERIAL